MSFFTIVIVIAVFILLVFLAVGLALLMWVV